MKKTVTAIILTLSLLLTFSGCTLSGNITEFTSYLNDNSYTVASGTVSVSDIKSIEINWETGSVKIEESDTDKISFSEVSNLDSDKDSLGEATENKELSESLKMRYKTDGGKLVIQFCKSALRVRTGAVKDLKKDLTVYVPKDVKFDEIKTNVISSAVYAAYLNAAVIELNGVSADLKLAGCDADTLKCDTVSGNFSVTTDGELKDLEFNSVSGDLTVNAKSVLKLAAVTVSANADLHLNEFDFLLTLSGVSTTLEDNGISYEKTGEKNYKFSDGAGSVKFESVSGKVRLEEK